MSGAVLMAGNVHNAQCFVKSKCTPFSVQLAHMFDDRPDYAIRLRQARERRGFKDAKAAADYFGWKYDSYAQHENGLRGITRAADRYAKAFKVSKGWLLTGEGAESQTVSVPLISWVSAGAPDTPTAVEEIQNARRIEDGELDPKGDWVALEVIGDSMDRISPPGSIIFVDRNDRRLVMNACYVIALENGEATYKRFRPSPDRFEPVSVNPVHEPFYPEGPVSILGRVRKTMLPM